MNSNTIFELQGFSIDLVEAWNKLRSFMFGGSPGRGAGELIQNAIDSYDASVPMQQRRIAINTDAKTFSITDWGSGLSINKIKLILTFGGTDKTGKNFEKTIGQFGIGFYSIFHKKLYPEKVEIVSKIENEVVQLIFYVTDDNKLPKIKINTLDTEIDFSTKISAQFKRADSVVKCLEYSKKAATNFPCEILINNKLYSTIWEKAKQNNWPLFETDDCYGFFKPGGSTNWIKLFCKYERVMEAPLSYIVKNFGEPNFDLQDYKGFPYVPNIDTVINCNSINLTISRDGFYLDTAYFGMLGELKNQMFLLLSKINIEENVQVVLANLYIFRDEIKEFLARKNTTVPDKDAKQHVLNTLANAKIFRISGTTTRYSMVELKNMLSENTPLFYSPNGNNLNYLGKNYKHDFILLPERCQIEGGALNFYNTLLHSVFGDIVNLDDIQGNNELIKKLVDRGIIPKEALSQKVDFIGSKQLDSEEFKFLKEIEILLQNDQVISAIENNLFLTVSKIKPVFFEIKENGAYISTGFFGEDREPLTDEFITNFQKKEDDDSPVLTSHELLLGLRKDHPLMEQLISSDNEYRSYYTLTYIAHELTASQKLLVPYSRFFHLKKENLAKDIRNALVHTLTDVA